MSRTRCAIVVCFLFMHAPIVCADEQETLKPFVEKAVKVACVEKVQALRTWTLVLKVTDRHEAIRSGTRRVSVQLPDMYRSEFESKVYQGDSPIRWSVVINGRKGWRMDGGETEELSAEEMTREKAQIQLQPGWARAVALLLDRGYERAFLPETKIAGRVAVGIKLTRMGEPPIQLYFDKETYHLLKTERVQKDGQRSEATYGDYREVGGIQVPHKGAFKTDGKVDYESDVEGVGKVRIKASVRPEDWVYEVVELKFPEKLEPKHFEKP